jgi:hypothetical protein
MDAPDAAEHCAATPPARGADPPRRRRWSGAPLGPGEQRDDRVDSSGQDHHGTRMEWVQTSESDWRTQFSSPLNEAEWHDAAYPGRIPGHDCNGRRTG